MEDSEDTIFSPVKANNLSPTSSSCSSTSSTTLSTQSSSCATSTKSISIKITSNTTMVLNSTKVPTDSTATTTAITENESTENVVSPSGSSNSSSSNSSTPKKHALVDYEYDSDEEEAAAVITNTASKINQVDDEITSERLPKRPATDSNSVLTNTLENTLKSNENESTTHNDVPPSITNTKTEPNEIDSVEMKSCDAQLVENSNVSVSNESVSVSNDANNNSNDILNVNEPKINVETKNEPSVRNNQLENVEQNNLGEKLNKNYFLDTFYYWTKFQKYLKNFTERTIRIYSVCSTNSKKANLIPVWSVKFCQG